MDGINMVDFAVVGLLLVSAFIGIARGFTREVLGIFAWLGALIAALYGLVLIRPLLAPYIKNAFVADVVSGLILFVVALFILGSLSRTVSRSVKGSVLGGLDRSLGFVFGIARGGAVIVIAYFISSLVSNVEKWPQEIKAAKSYPYVVDGATWLRNAIPEDAIKNLGLKERPQEEATPINKSVEHVVSALSQPKAAVVTKEDTTKKTDDSKKEDTKKIDEKKDDPKKGDGYGDTPRGDMERLVKNNE